MRSPHSRRVAPSLMAILAALVCVALLSPGPARAYEHRRGIPSVGGQLQRGYLGTDSDWTDVYEWGTGGTIQVRQYVARNRAIGFSFEQQKFHRIKGLTQVAGEFNSDALQLHILKVDYYLYFNRLRKWTHYAVGSFGGYRPEEIDEADEGPGLAVNYPQENVLVRLGYGLERFVTRTVSIDVSLSGYYFNTNSKQVGGTTASAQLAVGVHIYTGK